MSNQSNSEHELKHSSNTQARLSKDQGLNLSLGSNTALQSATGNQRQNQSIDTCSCDNNIAGQSGFDVVHYANTYQQTDPFAVTQSTLGLTSAQVHTSFTEKNTTSVQDIKLANLGYPTAGQPIVPQDGVLNNPTSKLETQVFDSVTAKPQVSAESSLNLGSVVHYANYDNPQDLTPNLAIHATQKMSLSNRSYDIYQAISSIQDYAALDADTLNSCVNNFINIASHQIESTQNLTQDSHANRFNTLLDNYFLASRNGSCDEFNETSKLIAENKTNAKELHPSSKKLNFVPAPLSYYLVDSFQISFTNHLPLQAFAHMTRLLQSVDDIQDYEHTSKLIIPPVEPATEYKQISTDENLYPSDLEGILARLHDKEEQEALEYLVQSDFNLDQSYADKLYAISASFAKHHTDGSIGHTTVHKSDLVNSALRDPGPNLSFLKKKHVYSAPAMISDMPRVWFADEINETLNYIIQHHEKYRLNQHPQLLSCVGNWCYDHEEGGFFIDETCAYLLGVTNHHQAIDFSEIVNLFEPQDAEKVHYNFTHFDAGTIFSDRLKLKHGPFAGKIVVAQGSAILRYPDTGHVVTASGFLCYEYSPQADFLFRELVGDGTFVWSAENDRTQSSPAYLAMLGYTQDEYPDTFARFCKELVHPDDYESLVIQKRIVQMPNYGDSFETCIRLKHKNGNYLWTIGRGLVLERNEQGIATKLIGSQSNIDLIHDVFDNIGSLMFTDSLTELYNRSYFTQNAIRYEQRKNQPMTVIFIDVTGLKLTNDILGHNFGDFLILKCVICIKRALLKILNRLDLYKEYRLQLIDHVEKLTHKAFNLIYPSQDFSSQKANLITTETNDLHHLFNTAHIPNVASFADTHKDIDPSLDLPEETIEKLLKQKVRPEIVRLAGDELLLLFPQCPVELAQQIKQEICKNMVHMNAVDKLNFSSDNLPVPLCFGIGHATVGEAGEDDTFKAALERADMRMLDNKEAFQEQNHALLKSFFEARLKREVSMRDTRRTDILTEEERQELRAQILAEKQHLTSEFLAEVTENKASSKEDYSSI